MNKELRWKFAVIFVVLFVSAWFAVPWDRPFPKGLKMRFGLDLQGGTEILYKLAFDKLTPDQRKEIEGKDVASKIINIIENRVNTHGLKEFMLRKHGTDMILIQLPGSDEEETANIRKLIETSGKLEFRLVATEEYKRQYRYPMSPPDHKWMEYSKGAEGQSSELIQVVDSWNFTGEFIKSAGPSTGEDGYPAISFEVSPAGQDIFADLTTVNVGRQLAIIMDGKVISAPVIKSKISDHGQITGRFTVVEQQRLITVLETGTFPVDLDFESMNRVGPGLGSDSIKMGIRAIVVSLILTFLFIGVYYLGAGLIADFLLMFNVVIVLGFMTLFGATMTLPGIAGLVLTVGMSVDANILIFERIREEKAKGKTLSQSLKNAYERVFVTILDSNITTLLTAAILYLVGTGPVKGFAVTLSVGLLASMFTAIFVSRALFEALVAAKVVTKFKTFSLVSSPNINFIKNSPKAILVSAVLISGGLLLFAYRGEKNLGIDFKHGTLIDFNLKPSSPLSTEEVRKRVTEFKIALPSGGTAAPYEGAEVQEMWEIGESATAGGAASHFEVRVSESEKAKSEQLETDIRMLFRNELIPAPFTDETYVSDLYRVSFDFDLRAEANVDKVKALADVGARLYPGRIFSKVERSYSTSFRYESDLVRIDPDKDRTAVLANDRIEALRGVINAEFELAGEFPKNLNIVQHADLSLNLNLSEEIEAAKIIEILKPFREVEVQPATGKSHVFAFKATGFKSLAGEAPFQKRIHDWKAELRKKLGEERIRLSEPIPRKQTIGPVVASELTEQATWAIILSLIVMVIYMAFRFNFGGSSPYADQAGLGAFVKELFYKARYGIAAAVALFHDVAITIGFIAIFGELGILDAKIDLQILAAFLTIIGYSLNDTIVIFDRVRENSGAATAQSFSDLVNSSVNQTLSRTILTAFTSFMVVVVLFILGGRIIQGFSFALIVGVVAGTYSTVFIAAPLVVFWEKMVRTVKPGKAS